MMDGDNNDIIMMDDGINASPEVPDLNMSLDSSSSSSEYEDITVVNKSAGAPMMRPIALDTTNPTTSACKTTGSIVRGKNSFRKGMQKTVKEDPSKQNATKIAEKIGVKGRTRGKHFYFAGHALRTLLLDLPVVLTLATYVSLVWVHYVHDAYLEPLFEVVNWDGKRAQEEMTYYARPCDETDLSATDGAELFLSPDATPEQAYQHQLKHGFTVFQNVLNLETSRNLRDYIDGRNRELQREEKLYVIEGEHRFSFGLWAEEPSVQQAVMEVANHPLMKPTLEKVLGPNPAVIEMTAITSSYGAVSQWYHDDVVAHASALRYARTFAPPYSVFIQLQNTTKLMGATSACPGTHYCSAGPIDQICSSHGFQMVGDEGVWQAGDAMLMNMNSLHRGAAHQDPNGEDRVMFVLTFSPAPLLQAESRQLSQGITFSLLWHQWGHTLRDLAHATHGALKQPWSTLRALGLYKPKDADWGVDYISGTLMRIQNDENAFDDEDLEKWVDNGGFRWLPSFLLAEIGHNDGWYEWLYNTMLNCEHFAKRLAYYVVGGYVAVFCFLMPLLSGKNASRLRQLENVLFRLTIIGTLLLLLQALAIRRVNQTDWAKDIQSKRLYTSTLSNDDAFGIESAGPSTFPTRNDVLIEMRYGSPHLELYNDFIGGHPGNRVFRDLTQRTSRQTWYSAYPHFFREAAAQQITSTIEYVHQGRFLKQGPGGAWHVLDKNAAIAYTQKEIESSSNRFVSHFLQKIRFLSSACRTGVHRNTAMALNHAAPYIHTLEQRYWDGLQQQQSSDPATFNISTSPRPAKLTTESILSMPLSIADGSLFKLSPITTSHARQQHARRRLRLVNVRVGSPPTEPTKGAWIKEGDAVEGAFGSHWFYGTVSHVSPYGEYTVEYPDGDVEVMKEHLVRAFEPYEEGEIVQVLLDGAYSDHQPWQIVARMQDGTYHAVLSETGEYLEDLHTWEIIRVEGTKRARRDFQTLYITDEVSNDEEPHDFESDDEEPHDFESDDEGSRDFESDDEGSNDFESDDEGSRDFESDDEGSNDFELNDY